MTVPVTRLEIDWGLPTAGSFAGEDETPYLRSFSTGRGRSEETDQQQAGRASIVLDNRTGRFDPANSVGARYPNVQPTRRVRVLADVDGDADPFYMHASYVGSNDVIGGGVISYPLFTGFVDEWHQTWDPSNGDAVCVARCTDGFSVLALFDFLWGHRYSGSSPNEVFLCGLPSATNATPASGPPFIPDDVTGARITRVLDCIGWPAGDRLIDAGAVEVWGSDQDGGGSTNIMVTDTGLNHLLRCADTEGGWLFVDTLGRVRFIDAAHDPVLDTFDIFGGLSGEQGFQDIEAPHGVARLWNDLTVTTTSPNLTSSETGADPASVRRHYPRAKDFTLLPCGFATLEQRWTELLVRYRFPRLRIPRLELSPTTASGWRKVLSRDLSSKVRVRKRPATAEMIEQDSRIEGISISSPNLADWSVSWQLSDMYRSLLSFAQTSPEGATTGWTAETNCSIAGDGTGVSSLALKMTATAGGDMAARTSPNDQNAVEVGRRYEATAYFRPPNGSTLRQVRVELNWRDSAGASLSSSAGANVTERATSAGAPDFEIAMVEADAPAGAAYATVRTVVVGAAGSEVHSVDLITLSRA